MTHEIAASVLAMGWDDNGPVVPVCEMAGTILPAVLLVMGYRRAVRRKSTPST